MAQEWGFKHEEEQIDYKGKRACNSVKGEYKLFLFIVTVISNLAVHATALH